MRTWADGGSAASLRMSAVRAGRGCLAGRVVWEQLSRPVDQDRLGSFGLGFVIGPLDEFAVDEGRSGADQGDEVGCVDGTPAVLR